MARMLSNGAVVDDSGQWYWNSRNWAALGPNPISRQPGMLLGKDRKDVAHLLRGRSFSDYGKVEDAGKELAQLVSLHGDLASAERALIAGGSNGADSGSVSEGPVASSKAGSKLRLVSDQLVLTIAADKGSLVRKPTPERSITVPLGRAQLKADKFGNAWVYDGAELIETFEACQPIDALEDISRKVMAVATPTTQNNSPSANAAPQVDVNTYRNEDDYERDARSRIPLGWRPLSTTTARGKVNMGRTLLKAGVFLPWAVMRPSRKGDPVTVTWVREGGSTAQPLPSSAPPSGPGTATDLLTQLERLGKLRDAGVLTEEEFQSQKENLLASDQ